MRRAAPFLALLAAAAAGLIGCGGPATPGERLEAQAKDYVTLALSLRGFAEQEVDAYFGPPELDKALAGKPADLAAKAAALRAAVDADTAADPSPRRTALLAQLDALAAVADVLGRDKPLPFDEEAQKLYGMRMVATDVRAESKRIRDELDALLPGMGPLPFRVANFNNRFVVPMDKREALFRRALEECRTRTAEHWTLPAGEKLDVEFTRDTPAAWHRYLGGNHSSLKVNPVAISFLGTIVDVACHEGYPGHHSQFLLVQAAAGPAGFTPEQSVVLLRSPGSVLREGAANYGVALVFPPAERVAFERDVLFPMAGFAPADAEKYGAVHRLIGELSYLTLPSLRDYRDGALSFNSSTYNLEGEALVASPSALLKFTDQVGAYVAGYTVARDRVRAKVEADVAAGKDAWQSLQAVLLDAEATAIREPAPLETAAIREPEPEAVTRTR
jgi:hypothetical protein